MNYIDEKIWKLSIIVDKALRSNQQIIGMNIEVWTDK